MEELLPPILDGTIEPGKVFDAVTDLYGVPGAYRDMADRQGPQGADPRDRAIAPHRTSRSLAPTTALAMLIRLSSLLALAVVLTACADETSGRPAAPRDGDDPDAHLDRSRSARGPYP